MDSTNITDIDTAKSKIEETTSLSLLSLAKKSTIGIYEDKTSKQQFLEFIVSGNQ